MPKIGVAANVPTNFASTRFRILIPSRHCPGYTYGLGDGDIVIFPKHVVSPEAVRRFHGIKLWDVCDDHFDDVLASYYRRMLKVVDVITCTTDYLAQRIKSICGRDAHVIGDPLEFKSRLPQVSKPKRLLWYGHSSNLRALAPLDLSAFELRIITNAEGRHFTPWSLDAMREGLDWCDCVIIPVLEDGKGPAKAAKSSNRMTEAINAGRYVVANPMPAYSDYGMWQGDIMEGLEWLSSHQQQALSDLTASQNKVRLLHSAPQIGFQWAQLFDSILGAETNTGPDSSTLTLTRHAQT